MVYDDDLKDIMTKYERMRLGLARGISPEDVYETLSGLVYQVHCLRKEVSDLNKSLLREEGANISIAETMILEIQNVVGKYRKSLDIKRFEMKKG